MQFFTNVNKNPRFITLLYPFCPYFISSFIHSFMDDDDSAISLYYSYDRDMFVVIKKNSAYVTDLINSGAELGNYTCTKGRPTKKKKWDALESEYVHILPKFLHKIKKKPFQ